MTLPITAILLALGAVEATAWWWMHPAPAGLGQPVLVYQPLAGDRGSRIGDQNEANAVTESSIPSSPAAIPSTSPASSPSTINSQLSTSSNSQLSTSTTTPLPDVYQQAAPMLRCTGGQVSQTRLDDTVGLHLAFFEWDGTDTGSVLEAFRHMPEACMGSIGMTLVSREKTIRYPVGGETLLFDHTIFREPRQGGGLAATGPRIHAFRAVWVAGLSASNARDGIGGEEFNRLRTIRLKSALSRFRPSHARVIQGAVRGAANGEAAWEAFESAMLQDLKFAIR